MVFSSIPFLFFFLPICLVLYYAVPFSLKNGILLIFSLLFYAWGEPVYVLLMLAAAAVSFIGALLMERFGTTQGKRRFFFVLTLILNLSALLFFKYTDFAISTVNSLFHMHIPLLDLGLPVGISFFTFQMMSYNIDLYRREVKLERNYLTYLMYVSMFPQLIAGPIVRFSTVSEELHQRKIDWGGFRNGLLRFMQGLFKKVLIANQIGMMWQEIQQLAQLQVSVAEAWLGAAAFTLQLYFDFSAYSDMAIGIGWMLGFHFPENFKYPLSAISVTDFWRRWHISLSTWFRDYVYIPLGGNRGGVARHLRNILIVWMLTGLWHGAAWNFVLWGLYYGLLLLLEKYVWGKALEKLPVIIRHLYALLIVVVGFVIFSFDDMGALWYYLCGMFGGNGGVLLGTDFLWHIRNYGAVILTAVLLAFPVYPKILAFGKKHGEKACAVWTVTGMIGYLLCFLLTAACLVSDTYNPFLYFRF